MRRMVDKSCTPRMTKQFKSTMNPTPVVLTEFAQIVAAPQLKGNTNALEAVPEVMLARLID